MSPLFFEPCPTLWHSKVIQVHSLLVSCPGKRVSHVPRSPVSFWWRMVDRNQDLGSRWFLVPGISLLIGPLSRQTRNYTQMHARFCVRLHMVRSTVHTEPPVAVLHRGFHSPFSLSIFITPFRNSKKSRSLVFIFNFGSNTWIPAISLEKGRPDKAKSPLETPYPVIF